MPKLCFIEFVRNQGRIGILPTETSNNTQQDKDVMDAVAISQTLTMVARMTSSPLSPSRMARKSEFTIPLKASQPSSSAAHITSPPAYTHPHSKR